MVTNRDGIDGCGRYREQGGTGSPTGNAKQRPPAALVGSGPALAAATTRPKRSPGQLDTVWTDVVLGAA